MNYKSTLPCVFLGIVLTLTFQLSSMGATLIDSFDEYSGAVNSGYIGTHTAGQLNPGGSSGIAGNWIRFGGATADGIYSISGGSSGRGASYVANWSSGVWGAVLYTFDSVQNFTGVLDATLDLSVNTAIAGTTAVIELRSGTTYFQSSSPLALTNTSYSAFTFAADESSLTRVSGSGDYASTIGAIDSVAFFFANGGGTGGQTIQFDNFNFNVIPEPNSMALIGLGVLALLRSSRKRNSSNR
ncbi:MAG: PEP-CTERM sorting domain-containing protein [Chthoniobacterales bacterium]